VGQGNASTVPASGAEVERPGERRQLTVLFCDLVGSTPLSQQLDAEEWRDVVEAYHRTAAAAVTRFGGHVAQYLGDGLLVYFGWPTAREDDPERAIRAGLAILDAMVTLNATLAAETRLAVRIGMHTGAVVIGENGAVFGDTPNIAARVQGAAEPDTVVITAATQRLVAGMFVVEDRGPHNLKGVRDPVTLYRVVQPSGVRSRLDVAAGRLTRFIGREVELATLVERFERVADGEGQTALLVGEAGVGKSRLAYELRDRLATLPHTWLECAATPYTQSTPFQPVIALVAQALALTPDDNAAEKLAKITRALEDAGLASEESVALVADFLDVATHSRLDMVRELQRRKTVELLAAWNLALSEAQPLVVLIEDLHWCDPSSLELLGRLAAQNARARILLVGTARPEFVPPWPARSNVTTIQLARLARRHARALVAELGAEALPAAMVDTLVERADGIPLYLEELTKSVVEPGAARGVDAIPSTLADSLMARLDRLSTAKDVAQRAAVIGRELSYELLASLSGMDEAALRHGPEILVNAEILFVRGEPPHATYTFKHALVQEAAYGALLKRTRQQLHGRIVDALRERFPEQAAAEAEVVARHAEAAGRFDEAIAQYGLAGERAQARSADHEAIRQFEKAIAILQKQPAAPARDACELVLLLGLGASLMWVHGYADTATAAAYERAVALATNAGLSTSLDAAQRGLAFVSLNRAELERAHGLLVDLRTRAEARGDRQRAGRCCNNLAIIAHHRGEFAASLAYCEQAAELCDLVQWDDIIGGNEGVARLCFVAFNLWFLGRSDAALAQAESAVELARQVAHPFSLAYALFFEISVRWCRDRGDSAALRARVREIIALGEMYGFRLWLGFGRTADAGIRVMAGDPAALADAIEGIALAAETGQQLGAPGLMLFLAELQRAGNELAGAQGTAGGALAVAAATGQSFWDADLHRLAGDLLLATGGILDEAAARYECSLETARAQGSRALELRAATSLARLRQRQGERDAARAVLAPVYAWFTEGFGTRDLIEAKALLDDLA
jgi:class 3 adenylate cyclase/tetratricopeptide (TPR) repeat protein